MVKKFLGSKAAILVLSGLSILVIIYLIASLGSLDLGSAKPFIIVQETEALTSAKPPVWNSLGLVIAVYCVFLLIILYFLLAPEKRKKYFRALAWLLLAGILVFLILSRMRPENSASPSAVETETQALDGSHSGISLSSTPTNTPMPGIVPPIFTLPQVSSRLSYFIVPVVLLVVAGFLVWLVWRKRKMGAPYEALAKIARTALDDIEAGKEWGDTILNSYYQMNRAVVDWRGIHRQESMTPAEFADYLVSKNLPGEAVHRLTALFERVRYGDKKSTREEFREAVDCLTAILDYCKGAK